MMQKMGESNKFPTHPRGWAGHPRPSLRAKLARTNPNSWDKHCPRQRKNSIHLINVLNSCPTLSVHVTRRVGKTTCSAQLCDYRSCPNTVLYQNCSLTEITQFELVLKSVSSDGGQFALGNFGRRLADRDSEFRRRPVRSERLAGIEMAQP